MLTIRISFALSTYFMLFWCILKDGLLPLAFMTNTDHADTIVVALVSEMVDLVLAFSACLSRSLYVEVSVSPVCGW
jgi:hypothetical protein